VASTETNSVTAIYVGRLTPLLLGIENIIQTLTNFGTRHTLSIQNSSTRGIGAARDWIHHEMLALAEPSNGTMEVFFNSYIQPVASRILFPTNITNVVARVSQLVCILHRDAHS